MKFFDKQVFGDKSDITIVDAYGEIQYLPAYRIKWLSVLVYSKTFEFALAAVILTNAFALGILTLPGLGENAQKYALIVDSAAFWIYVGELILRIISYGKKPWMFFSRGWNIFDFLIIGLAPFFQGQSTVLRLLRLLRLLRIFRFLPEVRILSASIVKSIPPLMSMSVLIALLLFIYGMAGVYLFGSAAPEAWGNIGSSMKSLFILLTLENFPIYLEEGLEISPLALPFFLSYVFLIVFTVLNVLIGIVLNAMDEARQEDRNIGKESKQLAKIVASVERIIQDGKTSATEIDFLRGELAKLKQIRNPKSDQQ
jgi:voltage-gated sodium channel